jgi:hypothetical protein
MKLQICYIIKFLSNLDYVKIYSEINFSNLTQCALGIEVEILF